MLTITDTTTGTVATCEPADVAETIRPWFQDAPEDVLIAIDNLQDAILSGESYDDYARYLDITIEDFGPELDPWPTNAGYNHILPLEEYAVLARCGVDKALKLSGEMGAPTLLVRQAFIKRALGVARMRDAQTDDRKLAANIFREAHQVASARWQEEHEELYRGDRMTGPALDVMRQVLGMTQRELAHDLKVDERTVRAWKDSRATYATPSPGIASEMWDALDRQLDDARALIARGEERGSVQCPIFTVHDDQAQVQTAALLLAIEGRRFNIDPTLCEHDQDERFCPRCLLEAL